MWAEEEEEEKEGVWEHHRGDVTSRPPSQHPSLPYSHHTHTHTQAAEPASHRRLQERHRNDLL